MTNARLVVTPNLHVRYEDDQGQQSWLLCYDAGLRVMIGQNGATFVKRSCDVGLPTIAWLNDHRRYMSVNEYEAWMEAHAREKPG